MLSSLLKSFANTDVLLLTKSEMSSSPISSWSTKLSRKHTEFKIKEKKKGKLKICHCSLFKTTLSKWRLRGWTLKQTEVSSIKWLQKLTSFQFDSLIQCPLIIPPPPATQSRLTRVSVLNQMDVGCWNITSLTPSKIFHREKLYFWNK